MEEHLDVRPNLLKMSLTCNLHHTGKHREHPRGHTRKVGNVLVHSLASYTVSLYFEIAQKCSLLLRNSHQVYERIDILDKNSAKVAYQRILKIIVGCMTTTKNKSLTIEHSRIGIVLQIHGYGIESATIVHAL